MIKKIIIAGSLCGALTAIGIFLAPFLPSYVHASDFQEFKVEIYKGHVDKHKKDLRKLKVEVFQIEQSGAQVPIFYQEEILELQDTIEEKEQVIAEEKASD